MFILLFIIVEARLLASLLQFFVLAIEWYKKAADAGNSDAMSNIGYMYELGKGVKQDYNKALEWYTKAFNEGDENAKTYIEEIKKLLNN